jgi:hypothetical protein
MSVLLGWRAQHGPEPFDAQSWHPTLLRYETSVCGLSGVSDDRLWHLGCMVRPNLAAIAAVEIPTAAISEAKLTCAAAPEPGFGEHGVILGWDKDPEAKDKRLAAQ